MKTCAFCGIGGSDDLTFCINCGRRLPSKTEPVTENKTRILLPKAAATSYLEFLGGPEDGRVIYLKPQRITVGRREDNDIVIESDTALSRHHAYVYYQNDKFWIEDRKSSFGTWINGERVPVEMSAPLPDGCLIRLAWTTLRFYMGKPHEREERIQSRHFMVGS